MKFNPASLMVVAASALLLAGCGGGGSAPDPQAGVPPSASESSAGFVAYVRSLVNNTSETREPVTIGTLNPPTPDNTMPEPVN
jgi:hypothetical protein